MKITTWLINYKLPISLTEEIYVVGKCEKCKFWGDEKDARIARTCQLDNTRRSGGDHCLDWEPE